jgi:hypothetical protein
MIFFLMALCEIESVTLWLTKHQKLILYDLVVMIFSTYALYRRLFISQEAKSNAQRLRIHHTCLFKKYTTHLKL